MKTIKVTGYEILAADADGRFFDTVAFVATEDVAREWLKTNPEAKVWPHIFKPFEKVYKLAESIEEI